MDGLLTLLVLYILWDTAFMLLPIIFPYMNKTPDWWMRTEFRPFTFGMAILVILYGAFMYHDEGPVLCYPFYWIYLHLPNFFVVLSFILWLFISERIAYWFIEYYLAKRKLEGSKDWNRVKELAERNDKNAQKELGMYYLQMSYIIRKNEFNLEERKDDSEKKAFYWLKKAACNGGKEAARIVQMEDYVYDESHRDDSIKKLLVSAKTFTTMLASRFMLSLSP